MEALRTWLDAQAVKGPVPSISLCVRVAGESVFHHTTGFARRVPPRRAVADQPYDLASVTKVLAGTAVVASLIEDGSLSLDTPAADHLPGVDPRVTVLHLLQHASGLPAWKKFYLQVGDAPFGTEQTRQAQYHRIREVPLDVAPGTRHVYSDVGFLWLLQIAESAGGAPFEVLFHDRVRVPSGVSDLKWGWPSAAATEWPCPYRHVGIEGVVHDLNCASIGGVSTHAGLFGTARSVAALGEAFLEATLDNPRFSGLPGATLRDFWTRRGVGSHRCGWDSVSRGGYTSTGRYFPDDAVGHLGYTGTSIWIVPSRRTVVALLTNRVHPIDEPGPIRALRPAVHDAVAEALGWEAP